MLVFGGNFCEERMRAYKRVPVLRSVEPLERLDKKFHDSTNHPHAKKEGGRKIPINPEQKEEKRVINRVFEV